MTYINLSYKWEAVKWDGEFSQPCASLLYCLHFFNTEYAEAAEKNVNDLITDFKRSMKTFAGDDRYPQIYDHFEGEHPEGLGVCTECATDKVHAEQQLADDYSMGRGYISEEYDRSAARSERLQDNLDEIDHEFGG